jgi:hypothetical protein
MPLVTGLVPLRTFAGHFKVIRGSGPRRGSGTPIRSLPESVAQTPSRWLRPWFYDGTSDRRVSSRPATGTSSLASPPQPERYFQARRAATGRPPADNASGAWPLIPSSLVTEGNRGPGLSRAPQWPGLTEAARARGGGVGCSPRVWHWRAPSRAVIQSLAMELAGAWQYRTGHESPPAAGRSWVLLSRVHWAPQCRHVRSRRSN